MSGTVTVGTNDTADATGDLIVTFVDASGADITTDGSRTMLPGQPWGTYLVAPSISPQPGCVVTYGASSSLFAEEMTAPSITDIGGTGIGWNAANQIIYAGQGGSISFGGTWTLDTKANSFQVLLNGSPAGFTANVACLALIGSTMWVENYSHQWFSWNGASWDAGAVQATPGSWMSSLPFYGNQYWLTANGEQQYYADPARTPGFNPFSVANGILTITANTVANTVANDAGQPYNSGVICSATFGTTRAAYPGLGLFNFTYGYVAARIKMPAGKGLWPTLWLVPTSANGPAEIDIMEARGSDTTHVLLTVHSSALPGGQDGTLVAVSDYSQNWHEYAVNWQADFITWFIDGVAVKTIATPADCKQEMYIICNLAVGGSYPGSPDGTTVFPANMQIDYIRVSQSAPTASARWESCSLIYQPPPHAATLYTAGGAFGGSGGVQGNPKFPAETFTAGSKADATAGIRGSAIVLAGIGTGSPPTQAAAVGYNTLTFGPAVQPLGTNLRAFSFFGTVPGSPTQNADGSITITTPSTGYGADLCTAGQRNGASVWNVFDGIAFGGGCYAEAVMSQTGGNVNPSMSFWLNDIESMNGGSVGDLTARHWPGQAADYGNWIEVDIAEFDASGDSYGLGDHNWYGTASAFGDANTGSYGGWVSPVTPSAGIDWSKPHKYGWLWVPASGTTAAPINIVPNSNCTGAVIGTPGTEPTGWDFHTRNDGLSRQVVATGTIGGKPYIDFRLFGTANGSSDANLFYTPIAGITAKPSTVYTQDVLMALVGTPTGVPTSNFFMNVDNLDANGGLISNAKFTGLTLTTTLTEYTAGFISASNAVNLNAQVGFWGPANGTAVDVTIRVCFPQLLQAVTSAGQGYQQFFFDDVQVGTTLYWNQWDPAQTPPPVQGTTAYNVLDTRHVAFIFGCGDAARPVTVYSLKVWQKDGSKNLGTNVVPIAATPAATAGVSGWPRLRAIAKATLGGAGGFSGDFSILHQSANQWFVSAGLRGAASVATGQIRLRARLAGEIDPIGGVRGDATRSGAFNPQQYAIGARTDGAGSVKGNPSIGRQYFTAGRSGATGGVIPFGGNAPLRLTNWVRNPRPEGAVIGVVDPVNNTGPTDWWLLYASPDFSWDNTISVTQQGIESGIPFVDLLYNNPSAPAGWVSLQTDGGIYVPSGLIWSYGVFVRLTSGSLANVSSIQLQFLTDGTTGFFTGPTITPTGASLASQWFHWDGVTINDPGMTNMSAGLVINTPGGAVNMTLRIGGPKAEQALTASGPQYLLVPQLGFAPSNTAGGSTSYVF